MAQPQNKTKISNSWLSQKLKTSTHWYKTRRRREVLGSTFLSLGMSSLKLSTELIHPTITFCSELGLLISSCLCTCVNLEGWRTHYLVTQTKRYNEGYEERNCHGCIEKCALFIVQLRLELRNIMCKTWWGLSQHDIPLLSRYWNVAPMMMGMDFVRRNIQYFSAQSSASLKSQRLYREPWSTILNKIVDIRSILNLMNPTYHTWSL